MKLRRLMTLALLSLLPLFAAPASGIAAQGSGCIPTTGLLPGLTLVNGVNAGLAALISSNSGASQPTTDCSGAPVVG